MPSIQKIRQEWTTPLSTLFNFISMASLECFSFYWKLKGHNWSKSKWMKEMNHSLLRWHGRGREGLGIRYSSKKALEYSRMTKRTTKAVGSEFVSMTKALVLLISKIVQLDWMVQHNLNQLTNLEERGL
jgi:hypothetical protein